MTTARLRKTFQYPADNSDDDDTPKDLDEEEQERFIEQLKKEDADRNELYKRTLLFLPIIAALSFLPTLATSEVYSARLSSLLCVTSLLTTAYTLWFSSTIRSTRWKPPLGYVEPANGVLSVLLGCHAVILKNRHDGQDGYWLAGLLPLFVFIVVVLAGRFMDEVDIGELERLKYGYKGA